MSKRRPRAGAKALVLTPLFRPRQEKAKKGKGSYTRKPRHSSPDAGLVLFRAPACQRAA